LTLNSHLDCRRAKILSRLYPQDKTQNASGLRRSLDPVATGSVPPGLVEVKPASGMAPLLARLIDQQAASGLAPAYLPKDDEGDET